jgi:hypothetical protein
VGKISVRDPDTRFHDVHRTYRGGHSGSRGLVFRAELTYCSYCIAIIIVLDRGLYNQRRVTHDYSMSLLTDGTNVQYDYRRRRELRLVFRPATKCLHELFQASQPRPKRQGRTVFEPTRAFGKSDATDKYLDYPPRLYGSSIRANALAKK